MEGTSSGAHLAVSTRELAAQITELAGHLNAANRRWLALIAEKVRALTRVACETTESTFLSIALHGTAHHVETIVRQYRRATEAAELSRESRQLTSRKVSYYWDDDGSLVLKARLPAEAGLLVLRALEAAEADVPLPDPDVANPHVAGRTPACDVPAGTSDPPEINPGSLSCERTPRSARRADALGVLAESFLAHGAEALSGGERHQIVVHVDHARLRQHAAGRCELDDGPAIPAESARRLACDSSIVTIVEDDDGEPLDVGRRTRSIPPALRRALNARDRGCRFPGCTHTRYVDGHHVHHWADGGAWRFGKPGGSSFVSAAPGRTWPLDVRSPTDVSGCDGTELAAAHRGLGVAIDATTAATRWRGERMDHVWVMDVLMQRWERSRGNVAAATAGMNP